MRITATLSGLALLLAAAPAIAADSPVATDAKAKKNADDKVICRSERLVGSNMSQRICMTRREWRQSETAAKNTIERVKERSREAAAERYTGQGN